MLRNPIPRMNRTGASITRWILSLLLLIAAIVIASLTIGRDIYYGTPEDGLLSFAIVNFSGYLFFLFMPVEVAFIYYLTGNANTVALNAIALITAFMSQIIDFSVGYILSTSIIDKIIGKNRYERAENKIRKYGNVTIFVFNFLPLSSPVISLAAGMLKYPKKDAAIFTSAGLAFKYFLLTMIFG